ncbi:YciI family protein [Hydrogenophaga sp.]|uniref:YciI family protein n=1 Tax=Hydrogenophaga sp. TaxID=1904254 RepID=UPI0035B004B8
MARWVVIFDDEPEMMAIRREREPLHLAYLERHADEILIAGGLREAPGAVFVGGLWVMEVASRDRAVHLIEQDPYYEPRLRRYRLLTWGKAFADRQVSL